MFEKVFKKLTIENPYELVETFKKHYTEWEIDYAAESSTEYAFYLKNPKHHTPFIIVSMPKVTTPMYNPYSFMAEQHVKVILTPKFNPPATARKPPVTKNMRLFEFKNVKLVLKMLLDAISEIQ